MGGARLIRFLVLILLAFAATGLALTNARASTTFTVNSTGDPGNGVCDLTECTIREAINVANGTPGLDAIHFAIPGAPVIPLLSPLPLITGPVELDGSTQVGFAGTPIVTVVGDALANGDGLKLETSDSTIKSLVIVGFPGGGLRVIDEESTGNRIVGNYIGVESDGETAHGNGYGLSIEEAAGTWVGGPGPGEGNLISGNVGAAMGVTANSAYIKGNRIGVSVSGSALPNDFGISFAPSQNIEVGGPSLGEGNVIANSGHAGIEGQLRNSLIQGNAIVNNQSNGIRLSDPSNLIGGPMASARNVISGNGDYGIYLDPSGDDNQIFGNFIGTDETGTAAMPNGGGGIKIVFASGNRIGDVGTGYGNVISGNAGDGVSVDNRHFGGNQVVGNLIGVSAQSTPLPNDGNGVWVEIGSDNTIELNLIAYNGERGVLVTSSTGPESSLGNTIRRNSIHDNGNVGIDLSSLGNGNGNGPTPNDSLDSDQGPNGVQNYPVIDAVSDGPTGVHVIGSISSEPSSAYTLDLYTSHSCDASGFGEGAKWLSELTVTTGASGSASFVWDGSLAGGQFISFTATDSAGNTSEFSICASRPIGGTVELATTASQPSSAAPAAAIASVGTLVIAAFAASRLTRRTRP